MSLNRATIIGYLGADPELRNLPSGQPVVNFTVATDETFLDKQGQKQDRVEWHHVVAFARIAETCARYLKKGRQVYVEGRLRTREYEAKNNGGRRQRTEIRGRGPVLNIATDMRSRRPRDEDRGAAVSVRPAERRLTLAT
jgi:single stranded DNA-binding protein